MIAHDITDPNAPLGWQCGDPGCREHGVAQFASEQQHPVFGGPKPRYWCFISIRYCPICGRDDTTRERRYDPRPDDPSARRDFKEAWDYCDAL